MTDPFTDRLAAALAMRYELQRELTGGGMSRVFVANEIALGRAVVVKVLPPDLAAGVNAERFRREIQLAAQLQHPHIVPLLSAGLHEDLLYYTMPYIEGESLRHRIERDGALPVRDVVRILHDVVEALAYAHERGVIHRDIKPGNILTLGPHALVTDFGVAKALSAALPHSGTTSAGMVVGSPAYMAPEQLAGDPSADHRVDLYAAGLLAYELLSGSSPFTGSTPQETMAAQLTRTPEPLHQVRDDVPPELSAVIEQALQKAPEKRHATAREMLADLERVSTPKGAVLAGTTSGRSDPLGRGMRFAAVLGVAGAIGIAAMLMTRDDEMPPVAQDTASQAVAELPPDSVLTTDDPDTAPSSSGERAPVVLSYEDSVAISEAIQRRSRRPGPIAAESLTAVFQRVLADSAVRAATIIAKQLEGAQAQVWEDLDEDMVVAPQIAPPTDRPRLVVADFIDGTASQSLGSVGRALADSLRARFAKEPGLEVIDAARTRAVVRRIRNPAAAGWTLRADLMVTGHLISTSTDAVAVQVLATDLRRGRVYHAMSGSVQPGDALSTVPELMQKLAPRVEEMATFIRTASRAAPRAQPPPVPPAPRPNSP